MTTARQYLHKQNPHSTKQYIISIQSLEVKRNIYEESAEWSGNVKKGRPWMRQWVVGDRGNISRIQMFLLNTIMSPKMHRSIFFYIFRGAEDQAPGLAHLSTALILSRILSSSVFILLNCFYIFPILFIMYFITFRKLSNRYK